jgi:hypothetical protein
VLPTAWRARAHHRGGIRGHHRGSKAKRGSGPRLNQRAV